MNDFRNDFSVLSDLSDKPEMADDRNDKILSSKFVNDFMRLEALLGDFWRGYPKTFLT